MIIIILGEVLDGWYQWRRILSLLANSETAVSEHPRLYRSLLTCLYRQLTFDPENSNSKSTTLAPPSASIAEFFQSPDPSEQLFLPRTLSRLFTNITVSASTGDFEDLVERAEGLRASLERRFGVEIPAMMPPAASATLEETSVDEIAWDTDEAPVIIDS